MTTTRPHLKLVKPSTDERPARMAKRHTARRQAQRAWDEFRTYTTIAAWATITGYLITGGHLLILGLIVAVIVAVLAKRSGK
jgi:hypothetical protein